MLEVTRAVLVVIDIQGKLAELAVNKEEIYLNVERLIQGLRLLHIPVIWTQQYPEGLGLTIPQIARHFAEEEPINKRAFSCCGEARFLDRLKQLERDQVLLTGIETHVCVYQTAADLYVSGYDVHVAADAVSSRTLERKQIGLDRIREVGCSVTCTETILFELLRRSDRPEFKAVLNLLK